MKVNEIITSKFIDALKQDVIPWRKPWQTIALQNAISGHVYTGINSLMLALFGNGTHYLTFNQAKAIGAQVKKGSSSVPIIYCNTYKKDNAQGESEKRIALRYYSVFSLTDCDLPKDFKPKHEVKKLDFEPVQACENLIEKQSAIIHFGGNRAFYNLQSHEITMPEKTSFLSVSQYYLTLFHELTHREAKELGEELQGGMNKESYSKEELVAEIGANFLANFCGLPIEQTLDNSKAYVQGWIKQLEENPQLIISAASKAQKRFESILKKAGYAIQETTETETTN